MHFHAHSYAAPTTSARVRSLAIGRWCTRRQNNVGSVTAGQAPHNSSNVGVVTTGQVGHNSSNNNNNNKQVYLQLHRVGFTYTVIYKHIKYKAIKCDAT